MAKERGHALTPDSQLFNPPPRPAEGKGKKFISVGKSLVWGGVLEPAAPCEQVVGTHSRLHVWARFGGH